MRRTIPGVIVLLLITFIFVGCGTTPNASSTPENTPLVTQGNMPDGNGAAIILDPAVSPNNLIVDAATDAATNTPAPVNTMLNPDGTIKFPEDIVLVPEDAAYFVPTTEDFALLQVKEFSSATVLTLFCFNEKGEVVSAVERFWFADGIPQYTSGHQNHFGGGEDERIELKDGGDGDLLYILPSQDSMDRKSSEYESCKKNLLFNARYADENRQFYFSLAPVEDAVATPQPTGGPGEDQPIDLSDDRLPAVLRDIPGTIAEVFYNDGSMSQYRNNGFFRLNVSDASLEGVKAFIESSAAYMDYSTAHYDWGIAVVTDKDDYIMLNAYLQDNE